MELNTDQIDVLEIFNLSPDLLSVACARTGKFLHVNDSFTNLLGHSRETFLTTAWLDFVHPDDVAATIAHLRQMRIPKLNNISKRYRSFSLLASNGRPCYSGKR